MAKLHTFLRSIAVAIACAAGTALLPAHTPAGTFEAGEGTFLLNGEPFVIKAAELHYPRIPRPYWDQRIKQCKALGMNAVCLYIFWNAHEARPGEFDFTGQNDLRHFIELCSDNDMKVILRPGPYVCAEWEMGGLPWWLLRDKDIRLRESDPRFLEAVDRFQRAVAGQVADLTIADGGPIIMVQVENEYGSYGIDKGYIADIRDMLRRNFGDKIPFFQCDWSSNFLDNGLDDLIWTINFGTGADIVSQFAELRRVRPDSPLMCSEFWSGWFDKWGANHETRPAEDMVAGIDEMLSKGISFSLYMTHGGTNWGHWAGANSPGYAPDVTSYDYDAPISESGQYTPKYHLLRNTLARYSDTPLPEPPAPIPSAPIAEFTLSEAAPIFDNLPQPTFSDSIHSMEEYDQGFGSILYRTTLPPMPSGATLTVSEPHDFAQIFVDGRLAGTLDRRNGERELTLAPTDTATSLDIFVEAMGRINFGRAIKDFKGITDSVTITVADAGNHTLTGWTVFSLPDEPEFYNSFSFVPSDSLTPADGRYPRGLYRGSFMATGSADTFLDLSGWGKGLVFVNGHPLGRFWEIGPQQTLFLPGCWLVEGGNSIEIFDILGPRSLAVRGLAEPVLDRLLSDAPRSHRREGENLDLSQAVPVALGTFSAVNGWQQADFPAIAEGRYLCIEALSPAAAGSEAAIAELYLLDEDGNRISRESWTADYTDSEETDANRTADKIFDLQESTFWSTAPGAAYPHAVVIDLGAPQRVSALQYLPRMEPGAPGAIGSYRIYLSPEPFRK